MLFDILQWIMSGIALTGTILNSNMNKWGQAFWIISNIYMCILGTHRNQHVRQIDDVRFRGCFILYLFFACY